MRKLSVCLFAALLVLGLTAVALAATTASQPAAHAATPSRQDTSSYGGEHKITGTLSALDADAKKITIKTKIGDLSFSISDTVEVTSGEKKIALADLTTGETVSVTYVKTGATHTATKIAVETAAPEGGS